MSTSATAPAPPKPATGGFYMPGSFGGIGAQGQPTPGFQPGVGVGSIGTMSVNRAMPDPTAAPPPVPQSVGMPPTPPTGGFYMPGSFGGIGAQGQPTPGFQPGVGVGSIGTMSVNRATPYSPQMTHSLARLRGGRNQPNSY